MNNDLFIINHLISGMNAIRFTSYYHTLQEAQRAYFNLIRRVDRQRSLIEISHLNTSTLELTIINSFEGTSDDLEDEDLF